MAALNVLYPTVATPGAAAANVTRIQALLNAGGNCELIGSGIVWINDRLQIGDNTNLKVDPRLEIKAAVGTNKQLLVSKCYLASWNSATLSWTAGLEATLTLTAHGLSKGDYVWVRGTSGTTDTAYFGTFHVKSVTDADNVVVALRALPEASVSGTIQAKRANNNISIDGGLWNFNYAAGNGSGDNENLFGMVIAGVANLQLRNIRATDTAKYCICIAAISGFDIANCSTFATNSDGLKIYGPSWDGTVRGWKGDCGDDATSVQTEESAAFARYNFAGGGSCLNITLEDIAVATQASCCSIYPDPDHRTDGITVKRPTQLRKDNGSTIRIDSGEAGIIGTLRLVDCMHEHADSQYGIIITNSVEVKNLEIDGLIGSKADHTNITPGLIITSTAKVHRLTVRRFQSINKRGAYNIYLTGTATVDLIEVDESYCEGSGGTFGTLIAVQGATVGDIAVKNSRFLNFTRIVDLISGTVGRVLLENLSGNVTNGLQAAISTKATFKGNRLTVGGQGMLRANGASVVVGVKTDGCNELVAGAWFTKVNGAETLNVEGDDIAVDISTIARFDGGHCYNVNAALGTLAAAGRVTCQGTASGSWHRLDTPALVY